MYSRTHDFLSAKHSVNINRYYIIKMCFKHAIPENLLSNKKKCLRLFMIEIKIFLMDSYSSC